MTTETHDKDDCFDPGRVVSGKYIVQEIRFSIRFSSGTMLFIGATIVLVLIMLEKWFERIIALIGAN